MKEKMFISIMVTLFCSLSLANSGSSELGEIKQKLSELDERTTQLEAKTEATDFRVYWKEGLNLATEDSSFKLKIGGRLMTDWFWSSEDEDIKSSSIGEQEDGVEVRRARIYFSGTIYDNVEYKLQLDFAGAEVAFKDAYLGITDFPLGKLRMGNFYEPFSLDTVTSSKYITFMERALPTIFSPERQTGFMLYNTKLNERMYTAVGIFRETDGTGENIDDGGYHITGRITGLPIYKDSGATLLHIGAAYSFRNPDDPVRIQQRPEAHLASRFVDTGSLASDGLDLLGLEAAWVNGPLSLQGEYIMADADIINSSDVSFDGYYVQGSYFLTGEYRSYKTSEAAFSRVKPKSNYSYGGGPGAWEVKVRFSELDLNDGNVTGGKLNDITAGLNWYLNPNTKIMWDWVHADRDKIGQADMLMMRL